MVLIEKKELIFSLERAAIFITESAEEIDVADILLPGHASHDLDTTGISRSGVFQCNTSLKQIDAFRPKGAENQPA